MKLNNYPRKCHDLLKSQNQLVWLVFTYSVYNLKYNFVIYNRKRAYKSEMAESTGSNSLSGGHYLQFSIIRYANICQ